MELHEALTQIATIRRQIARTEKFRGYRALPVAGGGVLALVAAAVQQAALPQPASDLRGYLLLWVSVAAIAGSLALVDVWQRHRADDSQSGALTRLACEQFAPCVVAGGLVTWVIAARAPQVAWMLPGVWAVLFSLGMLASFRLLPGEIFAVGLWYLFAGCTCLALGPDRAGLSPWMMGVIFGVGQLAAAAVLWRQEKDEDDNGP